MIRVTAPAKINLNLKILGKRDNGYHELVSLVGFTEFGDFLYFCPAPQDRLILKGRDVETLQQDTDDNLILKARDGMRSVGLTIPPTEIHLEKRIPIGGGLGGGSTDAAATICGLTKLYGLNLTAKQRQELALSLGADVPACLEPGWKLMAGIGDALVPLMHDMSTTEDGFLNPYITLANPNMHISTARIFSHLNAQPKPLVTLQAEQANIIERMKTVWASQDWSSSIDIGNDLTKAAIANCSNIEVLLDQMSLLADKSTLYGTAMSGSGSTCFALFSEAAAAEALCEKLNQAGYWATASQLISSLAIDT